LLIMQREREDIVDSIQKMEELLEETDWKVGYFVTFVVVV
jgi:hypothetical protein